MCEPILCGSIIVYMYSMGGLTIWYQTLKLNKEERKEQLLSDIDSLAKEYSDQHIQGTLETRPDTEIVFSKLDLPKSIRKVIKKGQNALDDILFKDISPTVKEVSKYLKFQKILSKVDLRLLYLLDPKLLIETKRRSLKMDRDVSGCIDGSYRSSIEFVASYRNLVGETHFNNKLEEYYVDHEIIRREEHQPWYFGSGDYEYRIEETNEFDSF